MFPNANTELNTTGSCDFLKSEEQDHCGQHSNVNRSEEYQVELV